MASGYGPAPLWPLRDQPRVSSLARSERSGPERTSFETLEALRKLQRELPRLQHNLDRVGDAKAEAAGEKQLHKLRQPLSGLDVELSALRDASRARFEAIEERLAALARTNLALAERIDKLVEPRHQEATEASPAEWGSAPAEKRREVLNGEPEPEPQPPQLLPASSASSCPSWTGQLARTDATSTELADLEIQRRLSRSASHFPALSQPLTPEWEKLLSRVSTFYPLVDVLRRMVTPNNEVDAGQLHAGLTQTLGQEAFAEILNACNGTQRLLGVAAQFVKIVRAHINYKPNCIFFDPDQPFWIEADCAAYFQRTGQRRMREAQPNTSRPLRQWGKRAEPST